MNTTHTKGPWRVAKHDTLKDVYHVDAGPQGYERTTVAIASGKEAEPNAFLIAEAGTVAHETGKTPRQLADENRALLDAVKLAAVMHPHNVTFRQAIAKAEIPVYEPVK